MSDFADIDNYFSGAPGPEEVRDFERRIGEDPAFAEEVAFYCSVMHLVKDQLVEEKKKHFRKLYEENKSGINKAVAPVLLKRLWPYITAAAVVAGLILSWYIYIRPPGLQYRADRYIRQQFGVAMGVNMAGKTDLVDAAIRLYNEGKLPEALRQFEKIMQTDSTNDLPVKMAGIVSLRLGQYDKAIAYFTQLENLDLYSNPGKFYHALALIKRNRPGDQEAAIKLLKQVIDQDLEEKETAQKWMESL